MKISFFKKIIFFIFFTLMALTVIVIVYNRVNDRLIRTESLVNQTSEVLKTKDMILNCVLDLETGSRGYIITGNEIFLEPYNNAILRIPENLAKMKTLQKGEPDQQLRISILEKWITERIEFSKKTNYTRKYKGFDEAQKIVATGQGKLITDTIRKIVESITIEQQKLLKETKQGNVRNFSNAKILFKVLFGFIVIILFFMGFVIYKYHQARKKSEEVLVANQIELEIKVLERTKEIDKINEILKQSEELLEATGELAKVGGWEIDTSNMTVRWTKEVYHIHEIEPGKMPEVSEAINYYAPEARPVIQKAVNDAITMGEGWDLELPFITAKGNRLWVRAIGRVENKDNTKRIFGIFQDITVRKIEEEKLKLHNEKLSEIAFLQSHQVRTPIANILGLISLINFNNLADPANAEVLENLLETTKIFDKIIADVVSKTNEIKKMGNNRDNFTVNKNELI